jgi:presenilin-like A22 family membrane protease
MCDHPLGTTSNFTYLSVDSQRFGLRWARAKTLLCHGFFGNVIGHHILFVHIERYAHRMPRAAWPLASGGAIFGFPIERLVV